MGTFQRKAWAQVIYQYDQPVLSLPLTYFYQQNHSRSRLITFTVTTGLLENNCSYWPNISKAITYICIAILRILPILPHNLRNRLFNRQNKTPSSVWIGMQGHPLTTSSPPPPSPHPLRSLSFLPLSPAPGPRASSEHGLPWLIGHAAGQMAAASLNWLASLTPCNWHWFGSPSSIQPPIYASL